MIQKFHIFILTKLSEHVFKVRLHTSLRIGQAVRHRFLVPAFAGSNPAAPAKSIYLTNYPLRID